ncbi:DHA2 family efflux MFS transporter permease subunit [Modestobacter sp. VKM Ac-2977]|uniref:DHA2 family efflux MFS transporter permease subunit n=1 Tax=Modestobacter sp. VKM Ac-2977 TaxID=3004131 RepID=UPI0022AB4078|nr:DHA2 family efflux MFS transporter permease subunit [Modestobacter sp. VKM Ac-2977]MCZ2820730.1 DHA2 family efflux MFS transporter permease subunit [Modestobacter sp. VKM Ac-2977]
MGSHSSSQPDLDPSPGTGTQLPTVGARRWAALAGLTLAVTLLAVDGTVLALAAPALTADLAVTSTQLLWIGDAYSFALAGLLISMGTLADRIGRKKLLLIGVTGFGLASLLAAFAPSAGWLIAARVLLGVAGATLMPSTLSLVRNLFPDPRLRTRAIAIWAAGGTGGAALGPLVGGLLLEHFWWGSVFLINIPVMAAVLVVIALFVPESRNPRPGTFDLAGALMSVVGIVSLVWAVKHTAQDGVDLLGVAAVTLGAVVIALFVRRQRRIPSPLVDVSLFARPAFTGTVVSSLLAVLAFSGLLFFFSQYLQLVKGYSPLQAGLRELPLTFAALVVVAIIAPLVSRLGLGRTLGLSLLVAAVGLLVLAVAEGRTGYAGLALGLVIVGLGFGVTFTTATDAVLGAVPPQRAGAASAISEMAYELGIALGIALLGTLHTLMYRASLPDLSALPVRAQEAVTESLAFGTTALGADDGTVLAAARDAFSHSMQVTSVIAAALLVAAGAVAWKVVPASQTQLSDDS